MQTVQAQNQPMQQMYEVAEVKKTDDWQGKTEKVRQTDAEPVRNGDSFPAMLEKLIAADKDVKRGSPKTSSNEKTVQKETGSNKIDNSKKSILVKEVNSSQTDYEESKVDLTIADKPFTKNEKLLSKKDSPKMQSHKSSNKKTNNELRNNLANSFNEDVDSTNLILKNPIEKTAVADDVKIIPVNELKDNLNKKKTSSTKDVSAELGVVNAKVGIAKNTNVKQPKKNTVEESVQSGKTKKDTHKQSKSTIQVEDLRTALNAKSDASIYEASSDQRVETDNAVDMTIDFSGKASAQVGDKIAETGANQNSETQNTSKSFSSLLAQEIRENVADFVQAGKIVLRDGNSGEIRLQLRPENLGAVKIKLELSGLGGKKVAGTVTVDTKEAYEAFEKSLDSLAQEFKQSGFESAEFNLNWSGSSQEEFAQNFDTFNDGIQQNSVENLSNAEKIVDTLNVYSYVYGSTVDILV